MELRDCRSFGRASASAQLAEKPHQTDQDEIDRNNVVQEVRHDQNQNGRDQGDDRLQNYDFDGGPPGSGARAARASCCTSNCCSVGRTGDKFSMATERRP